MIIHSDMTKDEIEKAIDKSIKMSQAKYDKKIKEFSKKIEDEAKESFDSKEAQFHMDNILYHINELNKLGIRIKSFKFV